MDLHCVAAAVVVAAASVHAALAGAAGPDPDSIKLDQPAGQNQKTYAPAEGAVVAVNPPPFIWVPPADGLRYVLDLCRNPEFRGRVRRITDIHISTHALTEPLPPGRWYWRYGVHFENREVRLSKARSFVVPEDAVPLPYPDTDKALAAIPEARPRLFITSPELAGYRERVAGGDLAGLREAFAKRLDGAIGEELVAEPPYVAGEGAERGKNYANIIRTTRPDMDEMETFGLAYLLTGDERYGAEAKRRILHFFAWDPEGPTKYTNNDEPAMWMMMRGIRAYDWAYDCFEDSERAAVEAAMRVRAAQFYDHLKNRRRFHTNPYESHAGRTLGFLGEA
ncbi:MAG: DUF4962 domain-containing protein, partial [Candidatus Hydrogenedentes bacterium]|nr:DUF4962 domain-containing protein [Candidatus Hydrogenedentota bacterium]